MNLTLKKNNLIFGYIPLFLVLKTGFFANSFTTMIKYKMSYTYRKSIKTTSKQIKSKYINMGCFFDFKGKKMKEVNINFFISYHVHIGVKDYGFIYKMSKFRVIGGHQFIPLMFK